MGTVQMTSAHGACIRALVFFLVREQMLTFVGSNAETNVAHTENNCLTTFEVPFEVPQISSNACYALAAKGVANIIGSSRLLV